MARRGPQSLSSNLRIFPNPESQIRVLKIGWLVWGSSLQELAKLPENRNKIAMGVGWRADRKL